VRILIVFQDKVFISTAARRTAQRSRVL